MEVISFLEETKPYNQITFEKRPIETYNSGYNIAGCTAFY